METLSAVFEEHPEKVDSLMQEAAEAERRTYRQVLEAVVQFAALPEAIEMAYNIRNHVSKEELQQLLHALPGQQRESEYAQLVQMHINTAQVRVGDTFCDFEAKDLNGNAFTLSSLKNKNILLLYGGLDCMGATGREYLKQLYDSTSRESFEIVIYCPVGNPDQLKEYNRSYPGEYVLVSDFLLDHSPLKISYGAQATPTCFFINSNGVVEFTSIGLPVEELETFRKSQASPLKPRMVVLTDIAPGDIEPDDMESMIRLLVHADLFEIEAVIASGGWNSGARTYPVSWMDSLKTTLDAYEKDLPNLMKRSGQNGFLPVEEENRQQVIGYWPSADYLRSRTMPGSLNLGHKEIGENNDSQGSDFIIKLVDETDHRPLWVTVWGGGNTLAQAIWRVKQERTEEQLNAFLNKLRVYTITDQDVPWEERHTNYPFSSHQWMRREFEKELLFIWDESAWLSQNEIGAGNWNEYATHIQRHGHLGRIYPKNKWGVEGDTPSFLHLMPNGLNNPEAPGQTGWGGYFEWGIGMDAQTHCYTNHAGHAKETSQKYEAYFYPATFNNFAARMDWAKEGTGNRNPVVIVNGNKGLDILHINATQGGEIILDASQSYDPDGDQLTCKWWILPEAGTYSGTVDVKDAHTGKATITVPADATGKTIHVICEVTDNGTHNLTGYRRVILSF